MEQFVKVDEAADAVSIQARLRAHLIPAEEGGYVVHCPSLDIVSQGETVAEARANIKEAIELVLDAYLESGALMQRLVKAGFVKSGGRASRKKQCKPLAANVREIRIPARIPLTMTA